MNTILDLVFPKDTYLVGYDSDLFVHYCDDPSLYDIDTISCIFYSLMHDKDWIIRWRVALAIGDVFSYIPDKKLTCNELILLTKDENSDVRVSANYSLARASIFKATTAESETIFREEFENALKFFEAASKESTLFKPASFCLPFYRSFYTITFNRQEEEAEVQKYLADAKNAARGSESKQKLLEAVKNLLDALREVHKTREMGFEGMKFNLNAYKQYCERAVELLETTEEKAPSATKLIWKGLPIIDQNIQRIIVEIQEKAKVLCKQTKGTQLEELGNEVNRIGQTFLQIRDPIGVEKSIKNMQVALSTICSKMPEEERGDACELLKKANEEIYLEDRINLINMVLSKIPSQISIRKDKTMPKTEINITTTGSQNRVNIGSEDKSINIAGDLVNNLENLRIIIENDYKKEDKYELLQTVEQIKQSCNDPSKRNWLREKLRWIITRTSEVASISSLAITLLQNIK